MKWQAVIVLLAIALTIFAPPALPLMIAQGGQAQIGTLDVCHSAAPALSANGEMPCLNSLPLDQQPKFSMTYSVQQKPFFLQLLPTFDTEHPPRS